MKLLALCILAVGLLLAAPAPAAPGPTASATFAAASGATPVAAAAVAADLPTIKFEKYTLPNGLEVILSQDRRLPVLEVNLWYHVGPANEDLGRTGFAHLVEHMIFQGAKHVPPKRTSGCSKAPAPA